MCNSFVDLIEKQTQIWHLILIFSSISRHPDTFWTNLIGQVSMSFWVWCQRENTNTETLAVVTCTSIFLKSARDGQFISQPVFLLPYSLVSVINADKMMKPCIKDVWNWCKVVAHTTGLFPRYFTSVRWLIWLHGITSCMVYATI